MLLSAYPYATPVLLLIAASLCLMLLGLWLRRPFFWLTGVSLLAGLAVAAYLVQYTQ